MTHRLTLLRHAKAQAHATADHERDLADSGRRQCGSVAAHLQATARVPQLVLCSTAARTQQTWAFVAQGLRGPVPDVRFVDALYLADVADILDCVAEVAASAPDLSDVLVIGHEPGISETAYYLAGEESDRAALAVVRVGVPTASLSLLHTEQPWDALTRSGSTLTEVLASPHS